MSEFIQGFQTTEGEKKYDYNALGNLPDLTISKEDVTGALGFVPPSKAEVEASVKVASNAAATADSKAVAAQTTANQAVGAAQQAQSTADGAVLAAQNAQNRADGAHERIDDSQTQVVQGSVITIDDCDNAPLQNLRIFGKTIQNGTPTPDAPVPLESVGDDGSVDVTVCGKNVLQITAESKTTLGVTFTVREDNTILVNGTCTGSSNLYYPISTFNLPAGSYEFSGAPTGAIVGDFDTYIQATGNVTGTNYGTVARGADNITDKEKKFTLTEECAVKCHIRIKPGIVVDNKVFKLMIRHASFNNGDYEPYKAQTLTVPTPNGLPGIPVTSGGNYTDDSGQQWVCDEVDFEKGQYIQRIYSYTFTGQETINSFDSGKTLGKDIKLLGLPSCIVPNKASGSNVSPMLCTHEAVTTQNALKNDSGGIAVAVWGDTQYLYFSGTSYGSVDGLKTAMAEAYASGNPYVWMYALETPIVRELNEAEKTDYTALHTNYPNTTVFNDAGAGMEVQYATPSTVLSLSGGRMNGSIDMVNHQLTGLPIPKNNTDAVSLEYLQETKLELAQGINDVSDIAYGAQETADEALEEAADAHDRIDDSQVQVVNGEVVSVGNSADAPLQGLRIFGRTIQNGEPKPDSPATLESVGDGGSVTATVCGRNLLTNNIFTVNANFNELVVTQNEDGSLHITGTAVGAANIGLLLSRPIPKGEKVYVYVDGNGKNGCRLISRTANGTKVYGPVKLTGIHEVLDGNNAIQEYFEAFAVAVRIDNGITVDMTVRLMAAETECEYEAPKNPQVLTISMPNGLPGIPVPSGGKWWNYTDANGQRWICDEIDFENGLYIQNIAVETFNGSNDENITENFDASQEAGGSRFKIVPTAYWGGYGMSNYTNKFSTWGLKKNEIGIGDLNVARPAIYILVEGELTLKDFRDKLAANPLVMCLLRQTPIVHKLSEIDPDALAQYAALHTNHPNTTILNDGNTGMEVKYATPTTALPLTGGRYKVSTPYAPTDAVPKSYADRIDKKVDTLREVVSSFHSNIVQEASGEVIQVYGSAEAPLVGMKMFGKTEQKTTTGKNLYPGANYNNDNLFGLNIKTDANGIITINGTATADIYVGEGFNFILPAGTYTVSGAPKDNIAYQLDIFVRNEVTKGTVARSFTGTTESTFILTEETPLSVRCRISNGITCTGTVFKPQIESGSIATEYEPYTGGIPSPNPDYPQALESVGDVRVGKNLIYCPDNTFTDRGVTTVVNNGCATLNGTSDAAVNITLSTYAAGYRTHLPAGTYTFSGHSGTSGYTLIFVYYDTNEATSSTKYIEIYQATGSRTVTFESDVWLGCYIYGTGAGVSYDNVRVCPQVELGSTATAYEPYTIKGGMPNVIVCGKNLFDYKRLPTKTYNGMTVTNNGDGSFTLPNGGTGEFLYYKDYSNAESKRIFRPGTYMLSLGLKNGATTRPYFFVGFRDAKGSVKELTNEGSTFTLTKERIESDGFFVRVGFYMSASSIATGETVYPMLRMFGDDTFENYKEPQTLPILAYDGLPGIPVSSGGNYTDENGQQWICDEVDVARGKYVQRLCTVSFDGSADESMDYTVDNTTACGGWVRFAIPYMAKSDNNITPNLLCNRFIAVRNNTGVFTEGVCTISSSKEHMAFISSMFYSVDTARTWFALHPITAIYEMETPIEIALSTEQLAAYTNKYGSTAKIYGKTIQIGTPSPKKPIKLINTSLVLTNTATGLTGLPGIPVNSGGNYTDSNGQQWICDEVDFEKGVYVQRVAFGTLTGDDVVGVQTDKSTDLSVCVGFGTPFDKVKGLKNRYCLTDVFPTYYGVNPQNIHSLGDIENAGFHNSADYCSYLYARIYRSRLATQDLAGVKDFLNNHNINILYQLATPIEIALPAEQLAEFADLHTNYSNTTVFNDKDAEMEMKYVADTKIYIDSKFDKLAEILVNKL